MTEQQAFEVWAVLELMGHRRIVGRVSEQEIAGHGFLRVDIPGDAPQTQFYSPSSVYAITPISEEAARVAATSVDDPISVWQLPANIRNAVHQIERDELGDDDATPF